MDEYLIEIEEGYFEGTNAQHYAGCGLICDAPNTPCPNCTRPLFPALNLSFDDPRLKKLSIWSDRYAHVLVCPACAHYMAPYFVHHLPDLRVVGGEMDGGEVIQEIDLPYKAKLLTLSDASSSKSDIPRHRVGGKPPVRAIEASCPTCKKPMQHFGVLDYDDLNVPLTENGGVPVALIIGDNDCLAISSCKECQVLRIEWVK